MAEIKGTDIKELLELQKLTGVIKRGNKNKIAVIKREIRAKIEKGVLAANVGKIFNEREVAVLMLDETVHLHNKYAAGNEDIDITKLVHEVFCSLFCEYLEFNDSSAVRYFAWYIRNPKSNDFTDYIGFKF